MLKSYFITDPSVCGNTSESLKTSITKIIEKYSPSYICLRAKNSNHYEELAKTFLSIQTDSKLLLHSHVDLAISLKAYGVHLSSLHFSEIQRAKEAGLYVIASTHSYEEALDAKEANAITYSPIFNTPNKGKPKGLEDLKEIMGKIRTNIFALGGITSNEQVKQVETCGVYGFASIRYFTNN